MDLGDRRNVSESHKGFTNQERLLLGALMMPTFIVLLNHGVLGVALPSIQKEFHLSVDLLPWALTSMVLPRIALMPTFGRLGDQLGKRELILLGLGFFLLGSIIASVAPTFLWLVVARFLQGIGAASFPLMMAMVSNSFKASNSGRALGIINSSAPIGMILGTVGGGAIIEWIGWQQTFIIISVICVLAIFGVGGLVKRDENEKPETGFDWVGAISMSGAIVGILLALTTESLFPMFSPINLSFWGFSLVSILVLFWNASRNADPFIDLDIFRNRAFLTPSLVATLRMAVLDGGRFILVLFLADVLGYSPIAIGTMMLLYTAPMFVGMVGGGYMADRWAYRNSASIGLSLQAVGFLMLGFASLETGMVAIVTGMLIASLGAGITLIPLAKGALSALGAARAGLASGLFNSLRFVGSAVAPPLLGLMLAQGYRGGLNVPNLLQTYQFGFRVLACVAAIGITVAFLIPEPLGEDLNSLTSQAIH